MKSVGLSLLGVGVVLMFPSLVAATPDYLVFGADYNYTGVVNANESIMGSTVIRPQGSTDGFSFGTITQVPEGKWGGGMLVVANEGLERTRYDVPSGFDPYNGMAEVWFKISSPTKITLLDLGGDNLVRWDPADGYLHSYLGSAGLHQYVWNIADGNWHHVALSWGDSSNWKRGKRLWFDGANVSWNDGNYSVLNPTSYIGTQEAGAAGSGNVYFDELHVYGPGWQNAVYWAGGAPGYFGEIGPLAAATPEPATLILIASGLVGFLARRRTLA